MPVWQRITGSSPGGNERHDDVFPRTVQPGGESGREADRITGMNRTALHVGARRHEDGLLAWALIAVTLALFAPAMGFDFGGLDDMPYVSENPMTRDGFSAESLKWAWTTNLLGYWAPLLWMSFMLDGTLFGPEPWGFHATNVLLHALNAALVFWMLRRWTGRRWAAFWAALLWAVHPLRVESVAWITERKDVLSGLFFFLCLLAYGRAQAGGRPSRGWTWTAAGCLALGLLVKPVLVTVPFVLLLLDVWPLGRVRWEWADIRARGFRLVMEKWPFWLLALALGAVSWFANFGPGRLATPQPPLLLRLGLLPRNYLAYLWQTVWPADLSVLYNRPQFTVEMLVLALVVLGLLTAGAWGCRQRHPAGLVGWLWFLGMLVPSIGFIWVGTTEGAGDRFTYLPHVGLTVVLAGAAVRARPGGWFHVLAAVLTLALAWGAWRQLEIWRNSEALFARAVKVADRNGRAWGSLGVWQASEGREAEAQVNLLRSLTLKPRHNEANFNLANLYLQQGRTTDALRHYRIAAEDTPDHVKALNNVAWLLAADPACSPERATEALALARRAAALADPPDASVLDTLGLALAANGDFAGAVLAAQEAVAQVPADAAGRTLRQRIQARLDAYGQGQMWRE
jgi:Tfp pilus assembly protein PilF